MSTSGTSQDQTLSQSVSLPVSLPAIPKALWNEMPYSYRTDDSIATNQPATSCSRVLHAPIRGGALPTRQVSGLPVRTSDLIALRVYGVSQESGPNRGW